MTTCLLVAVLALDARERAGALWIALTVALLVAVPLDVETHSLSGPRAWAVDFLVAGGVVSFLAIAAGGALFIVVVAAERHAERVRRSVVGVDLVSEAIREIERARGAALGTVARQREEVRRASREAAAFRDTRRASEFRSAHAAARSDLAAAEREVQRCRDRELELRARCAAAAVRRCALERVASDETLDIARLDEHVRVVTRELSRRYRSLAGREATQSDLAPVLEAARDARELGADVALARRREAARLRLLLGASPADRPCAETYTPRVDDVLSAFRRRLDESAALLEIDDALHRRE